MNIVVLNGSPKAELSATLHYVFYLQKKFPDHRFRIFHVCADYDKLERDAEAMAQLLAAVRASDGVLWAFPVYSFLVHSYVKRLIELLNARGLHEAFRDKYTATVSTSIHFFDHTAHNYMHAICEDWGMKFVGAHSMFTYDLLDKKERERLFGFGRHFLDALRQRPPVAKTYEPVESRPLAYFPAPPPERLSLGGKKAVILMDSAGPGQNLVRMVHRLRERLDGQAEVIDLSAVRIHSGCDGCFQCGSEGECVFRNADDINHLYLDKLAPADILVMAGAVFDRYLSWRWKLFFDRGFFLPLVPWWPGKQLAFLVSGSLKQLPNLRQILEGYAEFHQANLAGIVTDELDDSAELDRHLDCLASRLIEGSQSGYVRPQTFLGVGSTRIFRDYLWGLLRPVFQVGHRYYRKHRMYDFPQYRFKNWLLITFGSLLTRLPGVRNRFFKSLKRELLRPLEKVLAREKD